MNTVWKYEIPDEVEFTLDVPKVWSLLHVGLQGDTECIWLYVDTESVIHKVGFVSIGTGWDLDKYIGDRKRSYVGSIVRSDLLVKHIWRIWE
jgi:hypothetical protein